jgi:hypothetical protein
MNGAEFFVYMTLGLASGFLVNTGFVLQMVGLYCLKDAGPGARAAFLLAHMTAAFFGGLAPVMMLLFVVLKDGWDWLRMGVFVFWLMFSLAGSIAAYHQVAKVLNTLVVREGPIGVDAR